MYFVDMYLLKKISPVEALGPRDVDNNFKEVIVPKKIPFHSSIIIQTPFWVHCLLRLFKVGRR